MKAKSSDAEKYEKASEKTQEIINEIRKVIVGQEDVIEKVMIGILCDGNVLLESNPGMGKTKMIRTISDVMGLEFARIQNTPDLMPSDITGTQIIEEDSENTEFKFQEGPIFSNIVLADEINRATPKTQSALLEAMQEKQVTVGNDTYKLDTPFFLMATQNPLEQEGTYPLPEAQRDRFMMKLSLDYPSMDEEQEIVDRFTNDLDYSPKLNTILSKKSLRKLQEFTIQIPVANDIRDEAIAIVKGTRENDNLKYGASPRGSINLIIAAKGHAVLNGRNHVSVKDIEEMAKPVLRHRIGLSFEAEKKGMDEDEVIQEIIENQ